MPDCTLTCIDPFIEDQAKDGSNAPGIKGREHIFDTNVLKAFNKPKKPRAFKLKGLSLDHLRALPTGHFDFIYVDGSHQGPAVLFDAVVAFELLKPEGLMCFDDYVLYGSEKDFDPMHAPRSAITYFAQVNAERLEVLDVGTQVWLRKY